MSTLDYSEASNGERLQSLFIGDPVGDYWANTEVQEAILGYEQELARIEVHGTDSLTPAVMDTLDAAKRLGCLMEPTALQYAPQFSAELGVAAYFKREDTTEVKSFKSRGAANMMLQLSKEDKERGVLAASAGNHAQGVALSAARLGIAATIIMPLTTPEIKIKAVETLGARVELFGDSYSDAYEYSQQVLEESGRVFVHPFDDSEVIAGQGTIGKEILEQNPNTSHIFVPIGGGGLIAGVAQYVKALRPDIEIIGVQPTNSNAMQQSVQAGKIVTLPHVGTFADGVAVKRVGVQTFELVKAHVDRILTVSDDQVSAAIEAFSDETRSLLEPAGALAIAGARVYKDTVGFKNGSEAALICSGANISFSKLRVATERSEIGRGREALFGITLPETPGALLRLCEEVVNGHNITEFKYRLHKRDEAQIFVGFGVSGAEDKSSFIRKLEDSGYPFDDFSDDEFAKEHLRHMVGGKSEEAQNETFYEIKFPERPGALTDFLRSFGGRWNISLFHYRGIGADTGRALIGFEDVDKEELEALLAKVTLDCQTVSSAAANLFL